MNRIVREHYPVAKLPEDLREGLSAGGTVTVVIEAPATKEAIVEPKPRPFSYFKQFRVKNYESVEAVDAYIRGLRDEWSDR